MPMFKSLRFKLILGIVLVTFPLVVFAFYNNLNANEVVKEKVSETYLNTLRIFVEQVDNTLLEINNYLYKMESQDSDIGVIQSYPYLSDEYMLTKLRISHKLHRDIGFYNMINMILLHSAEDTIHATHSNELEMLSIVNRHIDHLIELEASQKRDDWHLVYDERVEGHYMLARIHQLNTGFYGLVLVRIVDIERLLDILWNDGKVGHTVIYSHSGTELTRALTPALGELSLRHLSVSPKLGATAVYDDVSGIKYMVMSLSSDVADIAYNIIIPERTMLKNIPFLQKATYFLPLGIVLFLALFLLFVNGIIFRPLGDLMRGMKKISMGYLDARLPENKTTEFSFLSGSFNNMAQEIKNLKIDVYEEQLRVREAEFKHLQAQISPHFYMNSLNIIYNFAVLGDQESVKKMSLYLADYFRFIMRTNRSTVTLKEELSHIENYMEIQKFRFPGKLEYEVRVPEKYHLLELPALIIQPFVENAIIHGFKDRKHTYFIHIALEEELHHIVITIQDSGVGFPRDVLTSLENERPLALTGESSRLGIGNVIHRLQLHFHHRAHVRFANTNEGGAKVRIELPADACRMRYAENDRGDEVVQFTGSG